MNLVIKNSAGNIVGIEVKASASVSSANSAGLRKLAGDCNHHFRCGIALHDGDHMPPFDHQMRAAPIPCL